MSMNQSEKLKLIRESERLKLKEVSEMSGISYPTYHGYESGKMKMSLDAAAKIFKHERFRKYRDWFMFDEIDPSIAQVAPLLVKAVQQDDDSNDSPQKTG